jgi:release factor glutamine methyltransferase
VSGTAASNAARRSLAEVTAGDRGLRSSATGEKDAVRLVAPPGVFHPRADTWLLAEAAAREPALRDGDVLDLCTGSGAIAVVAARRGARRVTAVDASRRAVVTARLNGLLNGARIRARRGDLFAPLAGERYDLVVANPPYVPAASDALPRRGRERAWDAGRDGRALIDRICAEAPARLRRGGTLLLVHSSVCGEQSTLDRLTQAGLEAGVAVRSPGPLGPILSGRADELERRGLLAAGARHEELLVIRATAGHGAPAHAHSPARSRVSPL